MNHFKISLFFQDRVTRLRSLEIYVFLRWNDNQRVGKTITKGCDYQTFEKSIGYFVTMDKHTLIWKPTGGLNIVDIWHGYYTLKFDVSENHEFFLGKGPWVIFDHYLVVCEWFPKFDPT